MTWVHTRKRRGLGGGKIILRVVACVLEVNSGVGAYLGAEIVTLEFEKSLERCALYVRRCCCSGGEEREQLEMEA